MRSRAGAARGRAATLGVALLACAAAVARPAAAAERVLDGFESSAPWTPMPASGVLMRLSGDAGVRGRALRIDFDFQKGGGYAVAHRALDLPLPANYRFRFRVRGECGPQNLEFKLIDRSGENVWWANLRDFAFTPAWTTVTLRKRQIGFAWGPKGGGDLDRVAALEFAVTAGSGGKGTVWLDELSFEALPVPPATFPAPRAAASSAVPGHAAASAADGDTATAWASARGDRAPSLTLDLGLEREFGGLMVRWAPGRHAGDYAIEAQGQGGGWTVLRRVRGGNGGDDPLDLPDAEARRVRLRVEGVVPAEGVAIRELEVMPLAWGATPAAFMGEVARRARRGLYPRGLRGEQSYWTVVGVDDAREEALVNEEGMVETGRGSFSIEPFLYADGRLVTWADVRTEPSLAGGDLPIPTVRWRGGPLDLDVTTFAEGPRRGSIATVRYVVRNISAARVRGRLFLALRPFQVNPPTQFLNAPGGIASIRTLALSAARGARVDGGRGVVSAQRPSEFGAASFDQGDITDFMAAGRVPPAAAVEDPTGRASGAFAYDLDMAPGHVREVDLSVPLARIPEQLDSLEARRGPPDFEVRQQAAIATWRSRIHALPFTLPDSALMQALRAQVAWILINRDSGAIQPGSRSYERSWIRDGSLTSAALLHLGYPEVVKEFLDWFAPYQYADGKVPCCVDRRGSDPVPEHDSHGEFIYLVAEYWRMTGDRAEVERLWPHVRAAAAYLDTLRAQRRTAEWRAPDRVEFFGLLPPSISHEGYSAKPMHSYWDDLFALRGYKDAALLARVLGRTRDAEWLGAARDTFASDLAASVRAAMARHGIRYVPGCADLGDFDATSTTIALNPVQADDLLPAAGLRETFTRYAEFFARRADGREAWDAFTPYEWRNVGAMTRLGMRREANRALDWLMGFRRPPEFQQWAEVVGKDERAPRFIGDMPHTWVGSDFVRSVLDMVAYERERDSALVVGAGLESRWLEGEGVRVIGMLTRWGRLSCTLRQDGDHFVARIESEGLRVPPGGIELALPVAEDRGDGHRSVTRCVDGNDRPVVTDEHGAVTLHTLPAEIHWETRRFVGQGTYR